ncbi:hypothetical protein J6590_000098 [Homalodisca vitripennis]|nr:hypothetical protein J6590_000098 [Homalodisca vitripennis]
MLLVLPAPKKLQFWFLRLLYAKVGVTACLSFSSEYSPPVSEGMEEESLVWCATRCRVGPIMFIAIVYSHCLYLSEPGPLISPIQHGCQHKYLFSATILPFFRLLIFPRVSYALRRSFPFRAMTHIRNQKPTFSQHKARLSEVVTRQGGGVSECECEGRAGWHSTAVTWPLWPAGVKVSGKDKREAHWGALESLSARILGF